MERRRAIKNISKSLGAFAVTPAVLELLQGCSGPQYNWKPVFYTQEEGTFVQKLIDTFLPAADDMPAASEVNVHVFLDRYADEILDEEQKALHRSEIKEAINHLIEVTGKKEVVDMDVADLEKWLDLLSGPDAENDVRSFIKMFSGQIMWAYRNTERVGETIMAYNPIPGKYEGCVDLMETTNGKAWSV